MSNHKRHTHDETKAKFDAASGDNTEVSVVMPVGAWTTATLLVLNVMTELEPEDKRTWALMELLGAFGSPVVERHPETVELIHDVTYRATGIRIFFQSEPR